MIDNLNRAIILKPNYADPYNNLGNVYGDVYNKMKRDMKMPIFNYHLEPKHKLAHAGLGKSIVTKKENIVKFMNKLLVGNGIIIFAKHNIIFGGVKSLEISHRFW